MESNPQILVLCTGNVCRSPYMESTLRHIVDAAWGPGKILVHSAGTHALVGRDMEAGSRELLVAAGLAPGAFTSRQLERDMVADADLVLTAERAHRGAASRLWPKALRYTFALADFAAIGAALRDGELPTTDQPGPWLREVVATAAARRGTLPPLPLHEADVVDPYRQGPKVFARMEAQIRASVPGLERALGARRAQ